MLFQRQTLQCVATTKPIYKCICLKRNTILSCQGYSPFWNSEKQSLNNLWSHYSPDDCTGHKRIRKQKERKKKDSTRFTQERYAECSTVIKHCKHIYISMISFQYKTLKAKRKYENRTKTCWQSGSNLPKANFIAHFPPWLSTWHKAFLDMLPK